MRLLRCAACSIATVVVTVVTLVPAIATFTPVQASARLFTRRFAGLAGVLAAVVTALTLVVATPANRPATLRSCVNTPIGCITEQQNVYLHHHPVLLGKVKLAAKFGPEGRRTGGPTLSHWGYFCAYPSGYGCINNWNGVKSNGNGIRFYTYPTVNGEWNQWYFGYVDNTFPWGSKFNLYTHWRGNSVYQFCWAPRGNGSGYCLDQALGRGEQVRLYTSYPTPNVGGTQFWVWDGNSRWVAVSPTYTSYLVGEDEAYYGGYEINVNNGSPFMMEPISHSIEWSYVSP